MISVSVNATDNKEIGSVRFRVDNNEWFVMVYNATDFGNMTEHNSSFGWAAHTDGFSIRRSKQSFDSLYHFAF